MVFYCQDQINHTFFLCDSRAKVRKSISLCKKTCAFAPRYFKKPTKLNPYQFKSSYRVFMLLQASLQISILTCLPFHGSIAVFWLNENQTSLRPIRISRRLSVRGIYHAKEAFVFETNLSVSPSFNLYNPTESYA